jgi:hypothetical protein
MISPRGGKRLATIVTVVLRRNWGKFYKKVMAAEGNAAFFGNHPDHVTPRSQRRSRPPCLACRSLATGGAMRETIPA